MNDLMRRQALSDFLRTQRGKLQPHDVGLPVSGRRRTPGLRREEVALLAGVSTTWYTWLEQGRDISVSPQVLNCIADALRLTHDERKYLFVLATGQYESSLTASTTEVSSAIHLILQQLHFYPAFVSDRRCNIIGWNEAAAKVFIDFGELPAEERNILWILFTRKEFKVLAENWNDFIRGFVAIFRSYYGQFMGDPWYIDFVDKISQVNPEFQSFWNHNEVSSAPDMFIEFRHAKAGKMLFDLTSLQVQGSNDIRISVYTPSKGTNTEEKIKKLVKHED
ncbi:hypothetical protein N007_20655 [Alicyclobacillus acidoterrestris ATCC 49025]|nr:hypothetical protein N007_20655 [Alicyclobacillus acidoterrestris ATCC 49025]